MELHCDLIERGNGFPLARISSAEPVELTEQQAFIRNERMRRHYFEGRKGIRF